MITWLVAILLTKAAAANPIGAFPINAQLPPVVRANEPFSFTFAAATFTSTAATSISYSLQGQPSWLHFDGPSRTFSGTPSNADSGAFVFNLLATDSEGSTTMTVTFIASADPGPGLGTPVTDQLSTQTGFSSPDELLIPFSGTLNLAFPPDTFTNTDDQTMYYATSADHSPLPSWIHFSPNNLSFLGTTPLATSIAELPQTFPIEMTASNVAGFAGAVATFKITVERHFFIFQNNFHIINVTSGSQISYDGLQNDLFLDGSLANASVISRLAFNGPSWLTLNSQSLSISGIPPQNTTQENFTVSATDIYGETATTSILILNNSNGLTNSTAELISPLGTVTATTGCDFQYDLHAALETSNATVNVSLGAASSWLNYVVADLELAGRVPEQLAPQTYEINVTVAKGSQSQAGTLKILVVAADTSSQSQIASAPTPGPSQYPTATSSVSASESRIERDKRWIALIVVLPILTMVVAILLFACCMFRRRRRAATWDTDSSVSSKDPVTSIKDEREGAEEGAKMSGALNIDQNRSSSRMSLPPTVDIPGLWKSITGNRQVPKRSSKTSLVSSYQASRRDSWQSYANNLGARPKSSAVLEGPIMEEETPPPRISNAKYSLIPKTPVPRFSISPYSSAAREGAGSQQAQSKMGFGSPALAPSQTGGIGHGRSIRNRSSGGFLFGARGIGHGDGRGPPGFGTVRDSWRNFRLLKMVATTDGSSSESEVYRQSITPISQKAVLSRAPDKASIRLVRTPSRAHSIKKPTFETPDSARPSTAQRNDQLKRLQEFHRKRLLMKDADRALFTAGPSSSRVSSYGSRLPETPSKNASNSSARRSPRRPNQPSDFSPLPFPSNTDSAPSKRKLQSSISEAFLLPDNGFLSRSRSLSPVKPIQISPHRYHRPRASSTLHQVRLPLIGHPSRRKDSIISDDFDSRWESASSDAASMDPYIYSRDPYATGTSRRRARDDVGSNSQSRSRWVHSNVPPHWRNLSQPSSPSSSDRRHRFESPSAQVRVRSTSRFGLGGGAAARGMERLAQGIKRLSYGRAEREGSLSDDDDDDDDDNNDKNNNRFANDKNDDGERGRRRVIRVGGPPGRSVLLGERVVGVRQGDPGNISFKGDISGPRDHAEGRSEDGEEHASAFV